MTSCIKPNDHLCFSHVTWTNHNSFRSLDWTSAWRWWIHQTRHIFSLITSTFIILFCHFIITTITTRYIFCYLNKSDCPDLLKNIWGYFQCFLPVFKVSQQSSSCRWLWGYWWCLDSRRLFISHWVKGKKVKLSFSLSKHTSFYMLKNEAFHYLDNWFCHNLVSWNRSAVERRRSCVDWKPADWRSEFHYWSQSVCICGF